MKRLFFAASLFSILNLAGLGALTGMAWKKGWLERDRVLHAASILRGETAETSATSESAKAPEASVKAKKPAETIQQTGDMIQASREGEERMRIEFARREREIQDGFRLWEARQLTLLREKEAFEEEKKRYAAEQAEKAKSSTDDGAQKELETFAGAPPKVAKDLLMAKSDADAIRILKAMDQRKLNKIVRECKTSEERQWIGRILEKFPNNSTAMAETLDGS